jgi:hypothetical protein
MKIMKRVFMKRAKTCAGWEEGNAAFFPNPFIDLFFLPFSAVLKPFSMTGNFKSQESFLREIFP